VSAALETGQFRRWKVNTQRLVCDHFGGLGADQEARRERRVEYADCRAVGDLADDGDQGGHSDAPPRYERKPRPSSFTVVEARVRALLAETPDVPATVLAERVGWEGSIRWFSDGVTQLRREHRPVDPADRLVWVPGDAAQCDLWFPPKKIPLEDGSAELLPVLVITAAHSRFVTGRMIPTRKTEDLLLGSWVLIPQLGRVPCRLIWDNEPGIGRGQRRAEGVASFMGTLPGPTILCLPRVTPYRRCRRHSDVSAGGAPSAAQLGGRPRIIRPSRYHAAASGRPRPSARTRLEGPPRTPPERPLSLSLGRAASSAASVWLWPHGACLGQ